MLAWIARGLRGRRATTRYPRVAEPPPAGYRGAVVIRDGADAPASLADVCPTEAIAVDRGGRVTLDRGRCILCGACVNAAPERFGFEARRETAVRSRAELIVGADGRAVSEGPVGRPPLGERSAPLRRSIHVRHIDCGSDGSEEWEIQALWNPYYDIQRLGFFLTSAPRHADVLLATGGVTAPMRGPLLRTWEAMPEPKALVAVGSDACAGGLATASGLTAGGIDAVLAVDVYVPGSPPSPIAILDGLLLAAGLVRTGEAAA